MRARATIPSAAADDRRECDAGRGTAASFGSRIVSALGSLWRGLRTATGDDAYERYLSHHAARHPDTPPLSRRAFYDAEQKRQWSRINRCC